MTDAPLSSDRLLSMVEDLVIHSENASATRLHPPLPRNQMEELQFHWEEIKYEWDDLLEAYQEGQLPEQNNGKEEGRGGNKGVGRGETSLSSSSLYSIEEIERWKKYREMIAERLGEIDKLLDPAEGGVGGSSVAGGGSGGGGL